MSSVPPDPDDDAALSWAGDETARPAAAPRAAAPSTPAVAAPAAAKPQTPAALLVSYGILAGAFLLYTFGWVVSVQRYNAITPASSEPLNAIMFGLGEILAMASPALWFVAAFLLTRGRKPIIRLLSLAAGLIAVLPWPFILGVWQ